ncbi:MAG: PaaI family thioesterase [Promethearchaeota archaeon]
MRYIDKYKEIVATHQKHAPISEFIDMRFTSINEGEATFELDVKPNFLNSIGTMQGGVISILADAAMGIACGSLLDENEAFSTIEFKINFFRPVMEGHLTAKGRVIYKGRKTAYTECEIFNQDHKIVAKSVGSSIIFPKPKYN